MVAVKWYWDGVKYPEVWRKHCSLPFNRRDECMCNSPESRTGAAWQWPRTSARTERLILPAGELRCKPTPECHHCPVSLLGQSKTMCVALLKKGGGKEIWIHFKRLWLGPNSDANELLFFFFVLRWAGWFTLRNKFSSEIFFYNLIKHYLEVWVYSIRFLQIYTHHSLFLIHPKYG